MHFDAVFGEGADVPHIVLLRLGELLDLGLVDSLAKLASHKVEHKFGQSALSGNLGYVSGLQGDAFAGSVGVHVSLLLFGVDAFVGRPDGFFFYNRDKP